MKCRFCMGKARVLETRTKHDGFLVERRHQCMADQGHRFTSIELPEQTVNAVGARLFARLAITINGARLRQKQARVITLLHQGWKPEAVASETGYTTRAVQRIRSKLCATTTPPRQQKLSNSSPATGASSTT